MVQLAPAVRRVPLSRDRVLRAAVALADAAGIESSNMRKLAQELGVAPMALYKHVANKDQLLDGMVDVIVGEIQPPAKAGPTGRATSAGGFSRRDERSSATPGPLA